VIKAGAIGWVRTIYQWGIGVTAREGSADGEDSVPEGFNWDLWVGPSAMRPFKKNTYHPFTWRGWFDFGNGGLADFCCHAINMPMRALDLGYPERLVLNMEGGKQTPGKAAVEFHFAARGALPPVVLHWQGSGAPPADVLQPLTDLYKDKAPNGVLVIGDKGCIYTSHWNTGGLLRLEGEPRMTDITRHAGTASIPQVLHAADHGAEWINACRGEGETFSPFEIGGKLTEIGLAAIVAIRAGRSITWDGEKMQATDAPDAARFVRSEYRPKWML
jgi:predicted dehydrogenase